MPETDVYVELASRLNYPKSRYLPLLLKRLATPEQAKILLELPASAEDVAKKLNLGKKTVDGHLQELFEKGAAFPTKKGYFFARNVLQLHDASLGETKYEKALGNEFYDLWDAFYQLEYYPELTEKWAGAEAPLWRIIPRWKAIQNSPELLPYEDIRQILKSASVIAIVHCPCKRKKRDRECGSPEEVCINLNRTAEYNIARGAGRKVTVEEALAVLDLADEHALIHTTGNARQIDALICNCHSCCCEVLEPLVKTNRMLQGMAKSRYEAVVDPKLCRACQLCIERCPFGAAQMKSYPGMKRWKAYVDLEKCLGCGVCAVKCPSGARMLKLVRPAEHIPEKPIRFYA